MTTLVGGWQLAGTGQWRSTFWMLPTNIYPTGTPIQIYGHKYPIQDCRSGICYPGSSVVSLTKDDFFPGKVDPIG